MEFYASYQLPDGRYLTSEKQQEYVANAEVLNAVIHLVNERTRLRKALGGSTLGIWQDTADQCLCVKVEIGHTLPENYRRLHRKADEYKALGYAALISGKWMNSNPTKIKGKEQEAVMRQLLRKHQNLDNEQIRSVYNIIAESVEWPLVTASTVGNYRTKWEMETHTGRHGVTSFENNRAMLVKRSAPSYPLYYWTADGWDAELLYQKTDINKAGYSTTTYHNRLTIVVILDPCCKYPVGYAIGTHETPDLIKAAMRNAINHTRELFGQRHKVLQLQTDKYGGKKLKSTYEAISEYYTPARVHNAKSKVIEPYFLRLNKKYCQMMNNWSGFGVASGSKNQPNTEMLNKIRHSFPDEAGCRMQLEKIMEMERALTIEKYLSLYQEMPNEDKKLITDEEYLMMLGESTGYTNRLSASGLVVKIEGQKYEYDSYDPRLRQLSTTDWVIKYDPDNKSQALAVSTDGSHRILLEERYVQPMALRERTEEDSHQLQLIRNYNKEVRDQITESISADYRVVDTLFNGNPQLNDTLAKLLLVDSHGQHKDCKSANRLAAAGRQLNSELETVTIFSKKKSKIDPEREYLKKKLDVNKYF